MPFRRVAIIGTGLIGASLGLALKRLSSAPTVVGHDVDYDRAKRAQKDKVVDRMARRLDEAVQDADLVLLSVPVRAMRPLFQELAPHLKHGTVISDTGSTKREVLSWAEEHLPSGIAFVGGHPMAGRLTSGPSETGYVEFANTIYCLTPSAGAPQEAVARVAKLVEAIGAIPYFLDPDEHDALVAAVSHVPYLLAGTLMGSVGNDPAWREMSIVAAGGFAAATRLVESDPQMFADICLTNRRHVARHLRRLIEELQRVSDQVEQGDESLVEGFVRAQELRAAWMAGRVAGEEPSPLRSEDLGMQSLIFPRGLLGKRDRQQ